MQSIKVYSEKDLKHLVRTRTNETKIGEELRFIKNAKEWETELSNIDCQFVLIGIPEDIGVRANYGRGGAHTAWKPAIDSFINQQSNHFLAGSSICLLGHIIVEDLMEKANELNSKNQHDVSVLRKLVDEIDLRVSKVITGIIKSGKIPIVIGGGHNNAYPIIKGCYDALQQKINVINCDPHTDFRPLEGRHSGNGFSYAFNHQYLHAYSVLCMHEQYNTMQVLKEFKSNNHLLYYSTYEDIFIKEVISFQSALQQNIAFVHAKKCGVEIDLDAITNVPTSAKTSSGISPVQARQFAYQCGKSLPVLYFHIAEGAPILAHLKADNKTGKLIAYLISDFIKGVINSQNN
ncbi:MAG: formimidoylglutamase [Bacteroidia bacterium]|nr:formimidoylglutamase [Bacteroidia bacterium]